MTISRGIARKIAAILLCSSLLSCVSVDRIDDSQTILPRIDELDVLADTDPISALEYLSRMSHADYSGAGGDTSEIEELARTAVKAGKNLVSLLEKSDKSDRLDDSLRFASSLLALSLADAPILKDASATTSSTGPAEAMTDLLLRKAENLAKSGFYAPGIRMFIRAVEPLMGHPDSGTKPSPRLAELLTTWIKLARKAGDIQTLELLSSLSGGVRPTIDASIDVSSGHRTVADWALGVVTVDIDKGLRISGGMAVPDRLLGSAFQIDTQGYYLTNYHVIASEVDPDYEGYSRLSIRPSGNPEARVPAKVIGWNVDLDIALLKSSEISARTFFLPDQVETPRGSRVFAIGSPVGLENSITSGIVSASGRRLLPRGEVIQIDVPVNPGNSGGPLLDEQGRLVGMVFAGLAGFQGLNFAMPARWIELVLTGLFEGGKMENPWLGLVLAKNLDSSMDILWEYEETGQFKPGDRLLALDGVRITNMEEAQAYLATKPLGSLAAVRIRRDESVRTLLVKVKPAPEVPMQKAQKIASSESLLQATTGMLLEHISGKRGEGGTYQVLRTWPGFPADETGISQSDVLKFVRYNVDTKAGSIFVDISVKSRSSGYLEKTLRLAIPLETSNFL